MSDAEQHVTVSIEGGDIYTPSGLVAGGQLLITGERILKVNETPQPVVADRTVDASGCIVIPGAIDTHSHHRDPGFTHKEDITSATRAAALGGVTTTVGMPNVNPPTLTAELYEALITDQSKRAVVDFNHNPGPARIGEIPAMVELGALGFKIFMVVDSKRSYPHMPGLGIHDHGELLKIFEAVAASGRPLMVHPNDQQILHVIEERHWVDDDYSYRNYALAESSYDGVVWNTAVGLLLELQRVTGTHLHVLHMMGPGMIRLIRGAKEAGAAVTSEVNAFALFLSDLHKIDHLGPLALGRCVPDGWVDALWQGVRDGTVDVLGSDHAPHTREEKEVGWENMWKCPSGTPQLQHYLARLLTAATQGLITVEDVVRITAHNPARRFGLAPRKGVLVEGADADVVVACLEDRTRIRDEDVQSKAGYTPYAGEHLVGVPRCVLVRGTVVAQDGRVSVEPGFGRQARPVGPPEALALRS